MDENPYQSPSACQAEDRPRRREPVGIAVLLASIVIWGIVGVATMAVAIDDRSPNQIGAFMAFFASALIPLCGCLHWSRCRRRDMLADEMRRNRPWESGPR